MARQLFVYWKADAACAAAAVAGMAAFQRALAARHDGLVARLYRRAGGTGPAAELVTLMESYACTGGVDAALQDEIVAAGTRTAAAWCRGERHVEVFDELPVDSDDERAR